jgi:hypothetical protein
MTNPRRDLPMLELRCETVEVDVENDVSRMMNQVQVSGWDLNYIS